MKQIQKKQFIMVVIRAEKGFIPRYHFTEKGIFKEYLYYETVKKE